MCNLMGYKGLVDLPKEGVIAYRVVRADREKKQYTSVYKKELGGIKEGKFVTLKVGVKLKATNKYMYLRPVDGPVINAVDPTGFNVFKTFQEAKTQNPRYEHAIARVRIYGQAAEFGNGYRAEYMKIEAICCGIRFKK